jgi:hypothetical protein
VNVECDTDANFKDDQGFFKGFPAFMFRFELRAKFLNQNMYFFIKTNVIYVDLQFKRWSYRVKNSLFVVLKLSQVCFHTKLGSWWQGLACMDFSEFFYVISRDKIRIFETPRFLISVLFKIIRVWTFSV